MTIAVTGGTASWAEASIAWLRDAGYEVVNLDRAARAGRLRAPGRVHRDRPHRRGSGHRRAGRRRRALRPARRRSCTSAAIPAPGLSEQRRDLPQQHARHVQRASRAPARLGIKRIIHASSETVLGLPFDVPPPYIPVDEEYPARPELHLFAGQAPRRDSWRSQLVPLGPRARVSPALRFSNVMDPAGLRGIPGLRRRPDAAQMESVGLHRRAGCRRRPCMKALETTAAPVTRPSSSPLRTP